MKKNTDALGFIPKPRMESYARQGRIILDYENDEPCEYLAFGGKHGTLNERVKV
jgi:hypothetical protein